MNSPKEWAAEIQEVIDSGELDGELSTVAYALNQRYKQFAHGSLVADGINEGQFDIDLVEIEQAVKDRSRLILGQQNPPKCPKCGRLNGKHDKGCTGVEDNSLSKIKVGDRVTVKNSGFSFHGEPATVVSISARDIVYIEFDKPKLGPLTGNQGAFAKYDLVKL